MSDKRLWRLGSVSFCSGRGHCSGEHAYHESPGDNAYLGGCADD